MTQQHGLTEAGEALESTRAASDLSQAAFAGLLGISRSSYLRRIRGASAFTATELVVAKSRFDLDLLPLL